MQRSRVRVISGRLPIAIGVMLLVFGTPAMRAQAQQATPSAGTPAPKADEIEKGRRHFVTYACSSCHGHSGQGSDSGPRLDTGRLSLQGLTRYVRQPAGSMPPYKTQEQISDASLSEIYAYLKSIPPPPDPKSIPLLRDE